MLKKIFLFALLLLPLSSWAQGKELTYTLKYGVENPELQALFDFENVSVYGIKFSGAALEGKLYKLHVKEYKKGELVTDELLFDGSDSEYFKIRVPFWDFKIFCKLDDDRMDLQMRSKRFVSAKKSFALNKGKFPYVMKDFLSFNVSKQVMVDESIPLLCIITPSIQDDGSGSYCEVANAKVKAEDLGKTFHIPHYFVISIDFQ